MAAAGVNSGKGMRRTDALQVGQLHAESAQEGDDSAVIDGDEHDDADGVKERQGGRGNHKAAAKHHPVHRRALHHEEAAHLPQRT